VSDVGILIVDDDMTSQAALKHVLGAEGWRVKIVSQASQALAELATGSWNLAVANIALTDVRGPLFAILRELSRVERPAPEEATKPAGRFFRVLFLVPVDAARDVQLILEQQNLPYALKPYHLRDFLEKVSDLLQEAGAIAQPIHGSSGGFSRVKKRQPERHVSHDSRGTSMFASRDDYQMTEEEIAEFERQEAEERKKREEASKDQPRY
jgi:DNA-binding response OmpR family regulator